MKVRDFHGVWGCGVEVRALPELGGWKEGLMRDYKKLEVWGIGREINKKVYLLTGKFPESEIYGLVSQIRRASISVISNIGEGCRCDSDKEFVRFLRVSVGSVKELECQFYAALDIGYIDKVGFDEIMRELDKLGRKLWSYIKYLNNKGGGR